MAKLAQRWISLGYLYRKEIWKPQHLGDRSPRGLFYALLRVVSITLTGIQETKAASRAAALSFSTLLGLGPLVAIAMLVAGFVLDKNDPNLAVNTLNKVIKFVAPQIAQYERLRQQGQMPPPPDNRSDVVTATRGPQPAPTGSNAPTPESATPAAGDSGPEAPVAVNPELVEMIDGFVSGSRSGTIGVIGVLTLILIVVQLFTSIETAFNEIWGVRRGRTWLMRVVFYWTVLTLGTVLFFAAVTGLSAGAFFNAFAEKLPFGTQVVALLRLLLPAASITALVAILTIFYRAIPNTHVFWRSAFIGAIIVALLLLLNNFLAFLYFRRVILSRSLYGSLGILPILMFGLYIFWLFILLGGQVSYAVQNVHFRNSQAAWHNLAKAMRERLSLAVLLTVCRRFYECAPPCTASQLGAMLKVPTQILNECLNRLIQMNLVTPIPPQPNEASTDFRYQPARPLNRITLADFKNLDDHLGDDPSSTMLSNIDPVMVSFDRSTAGICETALFQKTIEELLREHPIDTSRPPFLFGERRAGA